MPIGMLKVIREPLDESGAKLSACKSLANGGMKTQVYINTCTGSQHWLEDSVVIYMLHVYYEEPWRFTRAR